MTNLSLLVVALLFTLVNAASAQNTASTEDRATSITIGETATLEIVGFGDFTARYQEQNDDDAFSLNQVELDVESAISENITVALAVAYDDGAFSTGAFTVDWAAWEIGEKDNSSPFLGVTGVTIGGGQYDVPFGIDYLVYPSIDRKLVSTPLVIDNTHNEWNDYGGYISADAVWGNAVFFLANGFDFEGQNPDGEDVITDNEWAIGGRLGISLISEIEIGVSLADINCRTKSHDMQMAGADLQIDISRFELKGEYILHSFTPQRGYQYTNDGYYVQGLYRSADWYLVGRYDEFRPNQESRDIVRFSGGIGRSFSEAVELRLELQANKNVRNAAILQVAVGF